MSPSQSQAGRAFEYAIVVALESVLGKSNIELKSNSCSGVASSDFALFDHEVQDEMVLFALAAVEQLLPFESNLAAARDGLCKLITTMQPDQSGGFGDVRDVLITNSSTSWEIGISAKHQHEALKHSRLSARIDFGKQWFGHACSVEYFDTVTPIFSHLANLRAQGMAWSDVSNKELDVYGPVLSAFRTELLKLDAAHPGVVAPRMVQYLIGVHDFYKIIKLKEQAKLQVYNFNGSLNQKFGPLKPSVKLDRLKLPTRIIELELKREPGGNISATTLELVCDGGWQLSLRLHNASTRVEPSLKFDINLIGRPNTLQTFSTLPKR